MVRKEESRREARKWGPRGFHEEEDGKAERICQFQQGKEVVMVVVSPEHHYTVLDHHNTLLSQLGFKKITS